MSDEVEQPITPAFAWSWPGAAQKPHLVAVQAPGDVAPTSVCGRWFLTSATDEQMFDPKADERRSDCAACVRAAHKAIAKAAKR